MTFDVFRDVVLFARLLQRPVMSAEGETVDEVESRIHEIEHQMYPEVVAKLVKEI